MFCGSLFQFGSLPPGAYEIYAEVVEVPGWGAYAQVSLAKEDVSLTLKLPPGPPIGPSPTRFDVTPSVAGGSSSMQWTVRRKDLAGVDTAIPLQLINSSAMLAPGRWEVSLLHSTRILCVRLLHGPKSFARGRTPLTGGTSSSTAAWGRRCGLRYRAALVKCTEW